MARLAVLPFLLIIFGLPLLLVVSPLLLWPNAFVAAAVAFLGPVAYAASFVITAGLLSTPFQRAIIPGKFPRDLKHPVYGARRMYGLCWTSVYYFKPVYYLCLTIPALKRLTFRLFGYRGSMDFTIYPDTWIRDLPLLDFGPGSYIANRATVGTNMALQDGTILVNHVKVGARSMVGHLTLLGPGVTLEDDVVIDVACGIGLGVHLGAGAHVAGLASLHHFSRVGAGAKVGVEAYVGLKAKVAPHLNVPACAIVPPSTHLKTQADVDALISATNARLPRPAAPAPAAGSGGAPAGEGQE